MAGSLLHSICDRKRHPLPLAGVLFYWRDPILRSPSVPLPGIVSVALGSTPISVLRSPLSRDFKMSEGSQVRPSPPPEPPDPPDLSLALSRAFSLFILHHRLAQSATSLDQNDTGSRWFPRCIDDGCPSHYHLLVTDLHRWPLA
ncbi:unnamed protein product [Arabis nemorensis]|uniref:Uncharacterized protein n=1 Tax=Arabis nemorensis TaxID=586526 RepID=A0A565BAE5_9BRAS|nr:unnamed protein product [Arabis nemorensis]